MRLETPSLSKMWVTWTDAVLAAISSVAPMSPLVRPGRAVRAPPALWSTVQTDRVPAGLRADAVPRLSEADRTKAQRCTPESVASVQAITPMCDSASRARTQASISVSASSG